ncbi:MAG: UDP-N-acetylmuramoyl-tripeptide--D-alanyl-D-alanine ligase [Bacteroidaceae bacterium]|nr:UDP-N-acetylmuramoyl-tripeptide--D-alanyl-D-alanine ligase [Bacteroidaceae bacterium]
MNTEELYAIYLAHPVVTTDSRKCPEGSIFFALKGETFDGNQYAVQALEKGCAYAVVDNPEIAKQDERIVLVPDVLKALQELAAHHRREWGKTVLEITGTNGKTTTKELISAVLSEGKQVLFTEGNLNNHIGVPLTLLRIKPEHDIAVVETGANHPGEIADLCHVVEADFGLITNVGRAHLEGFGSFEGVKRTKGELYDDLHKRGKKIFLNAFDEDLLEMAQERGFALWEDALPYVEGRVSKVTPFVEMQWRAEDESPWQTVQTNLIGAYNIANLRAAVTIGLHFGITPEQINHALETYQPTNSRSELRQVGSNRLIVDAYNANPSSMSAALTNFSFFEDRHKMVILGDMRELGAESLQEHKKIVSKLAEMDLERIWLVGEEFEKAVSNSSSHQLINLSTFNSVDEVKAALKEEPITNCTILIKGSNSTKLHQLPEAFEYLTS